MRKRGFVVLIVAVVVAATAAVALAAAPRATTGAASAVSATSATVSGTVDPGGESTTYAFDYGTSSSYGSSTASHGAGSGSSATTVTAGLSGLRPGTTYHYRVVAQNDSGTAAGSDRTFTTAAPPDVGTPSASSIASTSATIAVGVNPHGRTTQVVFDYGATTRYGATTGAVAAGSGGSATTVRVTLTGLAPNTTYHVRARATSDVGATTGPDRSFRTAQVRAPAASTGGVTGVLPQSATLTGTATPHGVATQAYFEYGTSTQYGSRTGPANVGSGEAAVTIRSTVGALKAGTTYHYRVVASSAGGTTRGADRTFKTPAAPTFGALTASHRTVAYGHATALTGNVRGTGAAGAQFQLFADPYPFGAWKVYFANRASASGDYRIVTHGLRTRMRYFVRVSAAGTTVDTRMIHVDVRPAVTWTVRRTSRSRLRISGHIRPAGAATVYLRKVGAHAAVTIDRVRAHPSGPERTFAFTIAAPRERSVYRVRVVPDTHTLVAYSSSNRAVAGRR
jgi:hypothetical protein